MAFNREKYQEIQEFIEKSNSVAKIIAISKNQDQQKVLQAINSGVRIFGENRVQEAIKKFKIYKETIRDLELHLTGPLQTNKVKDALKLFDTFHVLDRKKLADEFFKHQTMLNNKKFFVQVNIGMEQSKSGIPPKDCNEFVSYCINKLRLNVVGLMCLPPQKQDPTKYFKQLQSFANENNLQELSMGMSDDFDKAIKCGATYIRVGTLLFGDRKND